MNKSEENNSSVVSTIIKEEIWKPIPGFTFHKYEASNLGGIRKEINFQTYKSIKQFENKTSRGTYLCAGLKDNYGLNKIMQIHVLVCLTFHGEPPKDGQNWDANHDDGNKHNNRADNLEWMTHSENMFHALKTGLRHDNLVVDVYDDTTKEWTSYYSISELARQWNLPRNDIRKLIAKHSDKLYLNRWLFKINKERLGKINRPHHNDVIAKDYVTNKLIIANDAVEMYYYTGVHSGTILLRIGNTKKALKNKDKLTGGYVFKELTSELIWPYYSIEEALESRKQYVESVHTPKNLPYLVKNYITGEIKEYDTLKQATKNENVKYSDVLMIVNKKELTLYKGGVFKRKDDEREWPVYTELQAEHSTHVKNFRHPPLQVTDTLSNTTKLYRTVAEFAREIGKDPDSFGDTIKRCINKLYLKRYKMDYVKL